ncbi:hypothetical protein [Nocardia blacklockiae]|uniref:hypothetical protein n=1 Tax=Nocardia blacklockiae TaxID=480036 RepID=UPI00189312E0|nr:hypothetical protein [Nocardia blacklockiae]MBF6173602.1 hypothetical protein [Nocardia blacklockiae]
MSEFTYTDIDGFATYHVQLTEIREHYGFEIRTRYRDGMFSSPTVEHGHRSVAEAAEAAKLRLSGRMASVLLWPDRSAARNTPPRRSTPMNRYAVTHTVTQIVDSPDPDSADALARQALADSTALRYPVVSDTADIHPLPDNQ